MTSITPSAEQRFVFLILFLGYEKTKMIVLLVRKVGKGVDDQQIIGINYKMQVCESYKFKQVLRGLKFSKRPGSSISTIICFSK